MHPGPPEDDLTERLSRLVSTVDDAGRVQLDRGRALVNALTDQLAAGQQLGTELEAAATTVVESAARAKASQTAVRAAAVAAVESLEAAAGLFADNAEGAIEAMTTVGENFVGRLFEVLDERDALEQ